MERALAAIAITALLSACGTGRGPSPVASVSRANAPPRAVGGGPVVVTPSAPARETLSAEVDGLRIPLGHATARLRHGHLDLALSDSPIDCAHPPPPSAARIALTVPPGPGGV